MTETAIKIVQTQIVAKHKYVHNVEMETFKEMNSVMMATIAMATGVAALVL